MLLATGIVALSRKVADERAKRREIRADAGSPGQLTVGDSDAAKRAFSSQSARSLSPSHDQAGLGRADTQIKYDDPNDIGSSPSDTSSPGGLTSPTIQIHDARRSSSRINVSSPVESIAVAHAVASPQLLAANPVLSPEPSQSESLHPPPPPYTNDTVSIADSDTRSLTSRSTNSQGTHAIRIRTKGADLKSGFSYHPSLFDLRVHPDQWERFTTQIADSTKMGFGDNARMFGAAAGVAVTGAIGTSVFVGRSMKRSLQEKKVRRGLDDVSEGSLGDVLDKWNENYFSKAGLFVHLELSDSALKNPDMKSRTFRKPALMYSSREDREKKRNERKFVLVVTKLDEEGQPIEAMAEIERAEKNAAAAGSNNVNASVAEIGSSQTEFVAELPGDNATSSGRVELPAELPAELPGADFEGARSDKQRTAAELEADITTLLQGTDLNERDSVIGTDNSKPYSLVNAETHAMFHKREPA